MSEISEEMALCLHPAAHNSRKISTILQLMVLIIFVGGVIVTFIIGIIIIAIKVCSINQIPLANSR